MPKLGPLELVIILVIVLLIFGAGKLPQIGGAIGKSLKEFRKAKDGEDGKTSEKAVEKTTVQASQAEDKEKAKS